MICSDRHRQPAHLATSFSPKHQTMKKMMRRFFTGHLLGRDPWLNTAWLLFRMHIGLSMAVHAGWPKMNTLLAPGWFNDQVAGLGYTFPSPAFWATLASWGEFAGGICIALGLLTRISALQLAFQFFVISFVWYNEPEPLTGMYFQQTLFWGYVLVTIGGGGRFSLDQWWFNRPRISVSKPLKTALTVLLVCFFVSAQAQREPLRGSGRIVERSYELRDYDKISLRNLNGVVEVQVGAPFGISLQADDNLIGLLELSAREGVLLVINKTNERNRLYIEDTHIRIRISLPEISVLQQEGNNDLVVKGLTGRYFRLEQGGNGDARLSGTIDQFDIRKTGNGNLQADQLTARQIAIEKAGNGDIVFYTNAGFSATSSGNGDLINRGSGRADRLSLQGNGKLRYENRPPSLPRLELNDFNAAEGDWKGQLRYLDYTSDTLRTIPASARLLMDGPRGFDLYIYYAEEPSKNDRSSYRVEADGAGLNGMTLVEKRDSAGTRILVFDEEDVDGNDKRPATIRRIWQISPQRFAIIKQIRWKGETVFFERHRYVFTR